MWGPVIGVIVGAVATFGATYFFEWRRNRRESTAAQSVACSELVEARRAIYLAVKYNKWPVGWHNVPWTDSWSKYGSILALRMSDEDFRTLHRAYLEMRMLQSGLAAERKDTRALSQPDKEFLSRASEAVNKAHGLPACVADVKSSSVVEDDEILEDALHGH
jgi:hypothetical protein